MPMSSGGHAASSSVCATKPRAAEIGSSVSVGHTRRFSLIGFYAMATAEHREPCDSTGSCTVLGAHGGATPPGDATSFRVAASSLARGKYLQFLPKSPPAGEGAKVPEPDEIKRAPPPILWVSDQRVAVPYPLIGRSRLDHRPLPRHPTRWRCV